MDWRALSAPKELLKEQLAVIGSFFGKASTPRDVYLAIAELVRRTDVGLPEAGGPSLTPYELKVFSQNGEDGVIAELIRRSGAPGRFFVEFGAGAGTENNCAVLAEVFGWVGLFIEPDPDLYGQLRERFARHRSVRAMQEEVTAANIEELLSKADVPHDLDLLSVDVDGSDLWIWEAVRNWSPRIVVIEYNSSIDPTRPLVQPRDRLGWDRTSYMGASIAALRSLATIKGYRLVHTELTGNNAFFVRSDLPGAYLEEDEVPVRPPNHFLAGRRHRQGSGAPGFVEYRPAAVDSNADGD